ncbi:winged helix-turn-helix domain-containing protein, partial [Streptococcus pseudopneumoniae]|uniref:helix-turn-helix domain-containing protein n=1 Tax=Streptococcus pseudopneumoniae TaxID=257758 RepID=UPI0018B0D20A|nr:winged helix-turn-helix domain-containing protein [Streptococcus pseudopneumoniae]
DHNCVVRASQSEIATSVGVSRESVNKAIKILVDQKIISYVAVLGYGLNMDIVRRGASK